MLHEGTGFVTVANRTGRVSAGCARGWRQALKFGVAPVLVLAALAPGARAQLLERYLPQSIGPYEADPVMAIMQQGGGDYRAQGVRVEDFVIRPNVTESAGYAQNPLGLVENAQGSAVFDTNASLSVQSDWSRNALGASVSIDTTQYPSERLANTTSSTAFLGGSLDIGDNVLSAGLGHVSGNLGSTDVLSFGQAAPVPYQSNDARVSFTQSLGRLSLTPSIDVTDFRFGRVVVGDDVENDTVLNKNQIEGSLAARYEVSGGHELVAVVRETDGALLKANAGSYLDTQALVGIDFVASALFRYDLLAGFERRQFHGDIGAIDTPVAELAIMYFPTRLTTVTARFSREIADPTYNVSDDLTTTSGRLTVDQAYRRRVVLQGRAGFDIGAANGTSGSRTDETAGAGVTWYVTGRISLALNYDFVHANGSGAGAFVSSDGTVPSYGNNSALSYSTALLSVHLQL
jgi:hypothetical protein